MQDFRNWFNRFIYRKQILSLLLCFISFGHIAKAQVYPIQVVTEITPPYSVYLSDYTTMGTGKLAVNILLTDVSRFNYPVKLRLVIEGEGGTITTSAFYMPEQIMLDGGSPLRLTGDELAGYFNPKNLDFKGYSKEKFMQTGSLPEGIYRIGFQALDYNKSIAVSLTGSATAWLVMNDPPMFNTPEKNAKLTASEPQNIMFQWMPRHLGSPNSAFNAEYIFQLYEIWPDGRNPNEVVASTQPLIEKTSTSTSFLYSNNTETPLIPGRQYAYRVQAHDVEGRDLFRNKGYSEVQMFTYGDPCDVPTQIEAQSNNSGKITIDWQPTTYNTAYYVQYREAGSTNGVWYPKTTYVNSLTIDNLKPKTKYEYQVQGQCGAVNSDFSEILNVTTQAKKETKVVCGLQDSASIITNKLPLTSLLPGDIITCGKFEAQVTKATGGNGNWTGEGFMHVPFMGVKVHVTFINIAINEKFQVTKGRMESVYNPDSKYVVDLNSKSNNTTPQSPSTTTPIVHDTIILDAIDTIFKTPEGDVLVISQTGDTTTIHRNADGSGVIINSAGDSTAIPINQPVVVIDSNWNTTVIDNNGNVKSNESVDALVRGSGSFLTIQIQDKNRNWKNLTNGTIVKLDVNDFPVDKINLRIVYLVGTSPMLVFNYGYTIEKWENVDFDPYENYKAILTLQNGISEYEIKTLLNKDSVKSTISVKIKFENSIHFTRANDDTNGNRWGYDEMSLEDFQDDHVSVASNDFTFIKLKANIPSDKKINDIYDFVKGSDIFDYEVVDNETIKLIGKETSGDSSLLTIYGKTDVNKENPLAKLKINVYKIIDPLNEGNLILLTKEQGKKDKINLNNIVTYANNCLKYSVVNITLNSNVQEKIIADDDINKFDLNKNGAIDQETEYPLFEEHFKDIFIAKNIIIIDLPILTSYIIKKSIKSGDNSIELENDISESLSETEFALCKYVNNNSITSPKFKLSKTSSKNYTISEGSSISIFSEDYEVKQAYLVDNLSNKYYLGRDIVIGKDWFITNVPLPSTCKKYKLISYNGDTLVKKIEIIPGTINNLKSNEYGYRTKTVFTSSFLKYHPTTTTLIAYNRSGKATEVAGLSAAFEINRPVLMIFKDDMKTFGETMAHEIMHGIVLKVSGSHFYDLNQPDNLMNWQIIESLPGERPLRFMKMKNKHYFDRIINCDNDNQWENIKR